MLQIHANWDVFRVILVRVSVTVKDICICMSGRWKLINCILEKKSIRYQSVLFVVRRTTGARASECMFAVADAVLLRSQIAFKKVIDYKIVFCRNMTAVCPRTPVTISLQIEKLIASLYFSQLHLIITVMTDLISL